MCEGEREGEIPAVKYLLSSYLLRNELRVARMVKFPYMIYRTIIIWDGSVYTNLNIHPGKTIFMRVWPGNLSEISLGVTYYKHHLEKWCDDLINSINPVLTTLVQIDVMQQLSLEADQVMFCHARIRLAWASS